MKRPEVNICEQNHTSIPILHWYIIQYINVGSNKHSHSRRHRTDEHWTVRTAPTICDVRIRSSIVLAGDGAAIQPHVG